MSGFLQRLASGVLHSRQAIHPAVGTIWSAAGMTGPGIDEPLAAGERFESSVDAPTSSATQPFSPQPTKPRIESDRSTHASENTVHKEEERPAIVEAVAFQPLVASAQWMALSTPPPVAQANSNTQQSEAISPPHRQASSPERTGAQPPHRIETARPLLPAPSIPGPAPASARKTTSAQSLSEERDSIEIHIGRIEVLAAPPRPVQPAAPRPTRKSFDLGEYLRGERRSR
jgi:hypothetical protein